MTKTYQNLISPLFSTSIIVDGETFDLRFVIGGKSHPKRINGKFRTSNPKLIKALDESPYYGKKWVCISSDEPEKQKETTDVETREEQEETGVRKISGPKTVKEMREYLNQKLGVPWSKLPNKNAAIRVAEEMNLNFVNVN